MLVRLRGVAAGLVALVPAAGFAVSIRVFGPRLGAQIATHWGTGPRPNGFSPTWGLMFWVAVGVTALATIGAIVAVVVATTAPARSTRLVAGGAVLVAVFMASTWVTGAWATADAADVHDATLGWRLLLLVAAPVLGWIVYVLLPVPAGSTSEPARQPYVSFGPTERAAWTGVISSRLFIGLGAGALAFAVLFLVLALVGRQGGLWTGVIVCALILVVMVWMTPARLTADRRGIRLVSTILRVPIIRVRLENIREVSVDTVLASQWGGWGYRLSGAGVAYVTRSGPGIVITRTSGSPIAITVDDPDGPAAVVNGLLREAHPTR